MLRDAFGKIEKGGVFQRVDRQAVEEEMLGDLAVGQVFLAVEGAEDVNHPFIGNGDVIGVEEVVVEQRVEQIFDPFDGADGVIAFEEVRMLT